MRFQLYRGDKRINCGVRSELASDYGSPGEERWYGFSVYLPETWLPDRAPESGTQWHQGSGAPTGSPPLRLITEDGKWHIGQRDWNSSSVVLNDAGPCALGQWTDWVFHVKWAPDERDGLLEIWKDGVTVAPFVQGYRVRTTFEAATRHNIKIGVYKRGLEHSCFW